MVAALSACATAPSYERGLSAVREALAAGDEAGARAVLEARLEREGQGGTEAALWRLELASVALRQGDSAAAAEALAEADPLLEVVDLTPAEGGAIASGLFADAARPYRSPAYEKLMVNVLGMASRLDAGDVQGALVEARRLEVIGAHFRDEGSDPGRVLGVGHLLAALAHDVAERPSEARLFHARAAGSHPELYRQPWWHRLVRRGELVVVVLRGSLPHKVERAVPAADAARRADLRGQGDALTRAGVTEVRVVALSAQAPVDHPATIAVDGVLVPSMPAADLAATARHTFERAAPSLARAAVTRALSRQATRKSLGALDGGVAKGRVGLGTFLGGLAAGAMDLGDVLDTRCWSGLPATMEVIRLGVVPGSHEVGVSGGAQRRTVEVDLQRPTVVLLTVD